MERTPDNARSHTPPNQGPPWRRVAVLTAGAAVTVAGTVVATLAATHKTAVSENLAAYMNGIRDATNTLRSAGIDISDVFPDE